MVSSTKLYKKDVIDYLHNTTNYFMVLVFNKLSIFTQSKCLDLDKGIFPVRVIPNFTK